MDEGRGVSARAVVAAAALLSLVVLVVQWASRRHEPVEAALVALIQPPPPTVRLWLSTADRRLQLARQPDIPLDTTPPTPDDLTVDLGRRYQTLTGFGAAMTDSSAWLIENKLNATQRESFLEEMFGPPPGLNLNMARLSIGASDFSRQHYTLDDMPAGQTDPQLEHFNVAANLPDVIPVMQQVLSINPDLLIIATPWSAPAWMKSSANLIGGALLGQYESTYADYLVRYVDTYRRYGIPIFALTVQNEPGFVPQTYPGMEMPVDTRTRIIGQYLGPALARRRPQTVVLGWDHNWDEPQQPLAELADETAAPYIAGVAWHCYRGDPSAQTPVHRAYPRKDAYITECSGGDWESAKNGELMWFARDLLLGGLRNWARGVVYWNLALDQDYGPHAGGCDNCKGMVVIDSRTGAITRNDEYYAFAHYSRFALPGAARVWSTANGKGIANVAFQNADDGSVVLVVVNSGTKAHAIAVHQGSVHFRYEMPAQSVATFVWQPGHDDDADNGAADTDTP
ncbi:glycoside hydrolase family 30 beta sandwich domain-containing protein [Rhodanobacter sp. PCA2]|uniref:glycoside hydrolase family 30 protein n=1 Tax=Rhodanobacter sp. PCA2 TaxID=2006117 RepID=UPI0015E76A60|nr:glycoside hydrolase family 30 beta sandwich domain-containing protein [Rhodanobacter sp. PCA2]MBA2077710.1 glycosyl hydrolase [Rhodanobacter sp. PCA2]